MTTTLDVTEEEYLIREPQAEYKHEFRNGRMVAMSGASPAHNVITVNLGGELRNQLKGRPCRAFVSDMRVKVAKAHFYTYPDVSVVCGEARFDQRDRHALINPTLIVEVLSSSTEKYDRGEKFNYYKKLPSLKEYVLVSQDKVYVEAFSLQPDGTWAARVYSDLSDCVDLASIGCAVELQEIYDKVDLASGQNAD